MACALAYRNWADTALVTASSIAGGLGPGRVQTAHVAEKWRGQSGTETLYVDLGAIFPLDTIALFGCNLTRYGSSRVRAAKTDVIGSGGATYDTGWVIGAADPAYSAFMSLIPGQISARFLRLDFTDESVAALEAGKLFIGPRFEIVSGLSPGFEYGYADLSKRTYSRGGQSYTDRNVSYRTVDLTFEFLTFDDRWGVIDQIDRIIGQRDDVLFISDTNSADLARDSLWAQVDGQQPVVQPYAIDIFRKSLKLRERL